MDGQNGEVSGDLAATPLASVLLDALRRGATGVLALEQGKGWARLYLRSGWPSGCQVCQGFKPLGQYLLEEGLIDVDTLGRSLAEMATSGTRHGEVLMKMGAVSPEDLERALMKQQSDYLSHILAIKDGAYRFEPSQELPAWTAGLPAYSPYRAILLAMQSEAGERLVDQALASLRDVPLCLCANIASFWDYFYWSDDEAAALSSLMVPTTVERFLATCQLEPCRARAVVAALWQLGLLASGEGTDANAGFTEPSPPQSSAFDPSVATGSDELVALPAPAEAVLPAGAELASAPPVAETQEPTGDGSQAPQQPLRLETGDDWRPFLSADGDPEPAAADSPCGAAAGQLELADGIAAAASAPENDAPSGAPPVHRSGDDYVGEILLQAFQGWLADHDATVLERRLWGVLNYLKGLS